MTFQSIVLVGNLGRDPEMRFTNAGQAVCHFSLAVSRIHPAPEGEEKKETCWFRVTTWGKSAESCNTYLKQGAKVLVEGRLDCDPKTGGPRLFSRPDGSFGANFEITANTVKFLSKNPEAVEEVPEQEETSLQKIPF